MMIDNRDFITQCEEYEEDFKDGYSMQIHDFDEYMHTRFHMHYDAFEESITNRYNKLMWDSWEILAKKQAQPDEPEVDSDDDSELDSDDNSEFELGYDSEVETIERAQPDESEPEVDSDSELDEDTDQKFPTRITHKMMIDNRDFITQYEEYDEHFKDGYSIQIHDFDEYMHTRFHMHYDAFEESITNLYNKLMWDSREILAKKQAQPDEPEVHSDDDSEHDSDDNSEFELGYDSEVETIERAQPDESEPEVDSDLELDEDTDQKFPTRIIHKMMTDNRDFITQYEEYEENFKDGYSMQIHDFDEYMHTRFHMHYNAFEESITNRYNKLMWDSREILAKKQAQPDEPEVHSDDDSEHDSDDNSEFELGYDSEVETMIERAQPEKSEPEVDSDLELDEEKYLIIEKRMQEGKFSDRMKQSWRRLSNQEKLRRCLGFQKFLIWN